MTEISPILAPVVALVCWTLLMMLWMVLTRIPAMKRAGLSLGNAPAGSRGTNLDGVLDDGAQWKAHNYNHLMEQPTLFYAIALSLVLMGFNAPINAWLAWGYVGFRIAHSLVQATVNIVKFRFAMFFLSSLCLIGLAIHAVLFLLHYG